MSTKHITTCDACGIEKKEVNHWFYVSELKGDFTVHFVNGDPLDLEGEALDVCGEACVLKLLQKWLMRAREAQMRSHPVPAESHL